MELRSAARNNRVAFRQKIVHLVSTWFQPNCHAPPLSTLKVSSFPESCLKRKETKYKRLKDSQLDGYLLRLRQNQDSLMSARKSVRAFIIKLAILGLDVGRGRVNTEKAIDSAIAEFPCGKWDKVPLKLLERRSNETKVEYKNRVKPFKEKAEHCAFNFDLWDM